MQQKLSFIYLGLYLLIFSSCAGYAFIAPAFIGEGFDTENHPYYVSDEPNFTRLTKEKDLKMDLSASGNNGFPFNAKLGYSPTKNFGILVNHYNMGYNNSFNPAKWNYHMTNIAGGGYYLLQNEKQKAWTLKNSNMPAGFLFDAYAGYGLGKNKNLYQEGGESSVNIQKIFLQTGIHYHHQLLGVSLVHKLNHVHFLNGNFNGQANFSAINGFNYIKDNNNILVSEISARLSFGTERVLFYSGFTFNHLEDNRDGFRSIDKRNFPFKKSKGYLGLVINLSDIWKKIKK